jgi:AcrR family transcriptional regulator
VAVRPGRLAGDARRDTRGALLDAAYRVVVGGGWPRARMADVAAAAGVSRQTLYNEFGSKDAVAQALAGREAEAFLTATEALLAGSRPADPAAAVATAVAFTLRRAAADPLLTAVLTDDASGLLPYLTTRAEPVLAAARAGIAGYLTDRWPDIAEPDAELAAEAVVRLTVSYLVLPSDAADASPDAVAHRVAGLVTPLLTASRGAAP